MAARFAVSLLAALLQVIPPALAIVAHDIEYEIDGLIFEGYIAYDEAWILDPQPGVMVVHNRDGVQETEKLRARELAERGMVGFAVDVLGKDCRGDPCARDEVARLRAHPTELRYRAREGLAVLARQEFADSSRLGANGYCFGGMLVLEMARAGMGVAGVASFHGQLVPLTGDTTIPQHINVQVHTGDEDPITANDLDGMNDEMRSAGLDYWASYIYGNCAHSWTDPMSGAYRQREGDESHEIMYGFYKDVFSKRHHGGGGHVVRHMVNETEHIRPLMQPSAHSPLARELARRKALEAELSQAQAVIAQLQGALNTTQQQHHHHHYRHH
jgi:dienelactone hydrolase